MAARRLIAILLVLLFLSSLAAALAPVQEGVQSDSSTSTTAEAPPPPAPADGEPRVVSRALEAPAERPVRVRVRVGDRLELKVTSQRAGTVEIAGLGPTEDVGPRQPAFFDLLLREVETYPVRFLGAEEPDFARIVVSSPRMPPASR